MKILRSILGVAAGFALMVALITTLTPVAARYFHAEDFRVLNQAFMMVNLTYTVTAAIVAGFITTWIAGRRELNHAAALGLLMLAISYYSMRQQGLDRPGWYEVVIGGCGPMAAMVGAAFKMLIIGRNSQA